MNIQRGILTGVVLLASATVCADTDNKPEGWLFNVKTDTERFELLQDYLGGFSKSMWEVGARYSEIYGALERENYDLALYHWDKIRDTIRAGYLKRPARQPNADKILLDKTWYGVREAFASRDRVTAWGGFGVARAACMACHNAEDVPFMNNRALFEMLPPELEKPEKP
jgi:hypothetical protein